MACEPEPARAAAGLGPPPSPRYARFVLCVLFTVYVFNFIDRQILAILLEPIKRDLGVSDTAMGFLTGFAFALFYTVAGLPIARLADRGSRRSLIALGLAAWSTMTALSGLAQNFLQLALARIGVGIGEAAGSPPAHSLLSDYFPPERRARALGFYSMGIYVGVMFGYLAGGWINEWFDWRTAFFVVGLPGLVLALFVRLAVREPPRGWSEPGASDAGAEPLARVARFLWSLRSFRRLALAAALSAFAGYGFGAWVPAFLMRVHGMGTGEVGTWVGLLTGVGGAAGALGGGALADRLGARAPRWYLLVPALSILASLPFLATFLLLSETPGALLCYLPAVVAGAMYLGPTFSVTQGLVRLRMRAVASAWLLFVVNLIGLGAGPQAVGLLNDLLAPRLGAEAVRYSLLLVGATGFGAAALFAAAARSLDREGLRARETLR